MGLCTGQCRLEFVHAHNRNETDEEQEEREENTKRPSCRQNIDNGRMEITPGRGIARIKTSERHRRTALNQKS